MLYNPIPTPQVRAIQFDGENKMTILRWLQEGLKNRSSEFAKRYARGDAGENLVYIETTARYKTGGYADAGLKFNGEIFVNNPDSQGPLGNLRVIVEFMNDYRACLVAPTNWVVMHLDKPMVEVLSDHQFRAAYDINSAQGEK